MNFTKLTIILIGITLTVAGVMYVENGSLDFMSGSESYTSEQATTSPAEMSDSQFDQYKAEWKEDERNKEEFQQTLEDELEKRFWQNHIDRGTEKMRELEDRGFSGQEVSRIKEYLSNRNPALVHLAAEIVKLPDHKLALAIAMQETTLCQYGVGASRNNCGGIKRSDGTFKRYRNVFDSIEDITIVLNRPHMKNLTITEMSSTYCVHEAAGGGPCPGWKENVQKELATLSGI